MIPDGKAFAYSGPARVKVGLLPVYIEPSVTSGMVKLLKKGDLVHVEGETVIFRRSMVRR